MTDTYWKTHERHYYNCLRYKQHCSSAVRVYIVPANHPQPTPLPLALGLKAAVDDDPAPSAILAVGARTVEVVVWKRAAAPAAPASAAATVFAATGAWECLVRSVLATTEENMQTREQLHCL